MKVFLALALLLYCQCQAKTLGHEDPIWDQLRQEVGERLVRPQSPLQICHSAPNSAACSDMLERMSDPFFLQSQPATTESSGWLDAWTSALSVYAVAAESAEDVVAAVNFAREHDIKLVVRGAGHSYQGRSCAPNSLLLWTRPMNGLMLHEDFVPHGAPENVHPVNALTAGAGAIWAAAYNLVTTENSRYVQGGNCLTVGVAGGFLQSGGFGSFSKYFGTAAASWLEAEVVTADGRVLIANDYQNSDLFWALKGGGGGTFGIVTRVTLLTHPLAETIGRVSGSIQATSDDAYRDLIAQIVKLSRASLLSRHWGDEVEISPDNRVNLALRWIDLTENEVRRLWEPLFSWLQARPGDYSHEIQFESIPARKLWDRSFWQRLKPADIQPNLHPGPHSHFSDLFVWKGATHEASAYWYGMHSRWIPAKLFAEENEKTVVAMLFDASRHATLEMRYNKGLAEAAPAVLDRENNTSLNPVAQSASMLILGSAFASDVFPGIAGHEPDPTIGRAKREQLTRAFEIITSATPDSGSYFTQSDFFLADWQTEFWGANYPRLLEIKRKYDPNNFFSVHHGVGSEQSTLD